MIYFSTMSILMGGTEKVLVVSFEGQIEHPRCDVMHYSLVASNQMRI